jgi:membrane protease YdiL (CAAX protease family)
MEYRQGTIAMANLKQSDAAAAVPASMVPLPASGTRRNIVLFVAGVIAIAWAANYLANRASGGDPAMASVGISITAMGPLLLAVLLRKLSGQGWANAGLASRYGQSKGWYALGLAYTPLVILFIAVLAVSLGVAQLAPDPGAAAGSMLQIFGITLGPMLFLSIGEEFGWRGYLEPELWSINQRAVLNHVFIGIIWGLWHFPILIFAPDNDISAAQLAMVVTGAVALAIIYGQMRLRSGSVWPCVILHAVSNAAFVAVGSSKLLRFDPNTTDFISFNSTSLAVVGTWLASALILLASIKSAPAEFRPSDR